ncbi:MAG: hypothetical protein AVDCRST_MAG19-4507 [uncultured Thermomicrobiales bacterium]|uniref:Uncharacterized protein n=1 Tax=uncultured Thermomicrobiales bacterium TaxID=1645740 RepID=A0A6J4VQY3_9BACT|nr:MAG: hypothetical protein AVDCRST_MAG19-4507 [uncultured Thermomicrobiales bacterium]
MTTHPAGLEADAHGRAMDPDTTESDLLGLIGAHATHLARWADDPREEHERQDRAMLRGAMRAWLERTEANGGETAR